MSLSRWMRQNPDLVYETFSDMSISALASRIDDDIALGEYIRQQIVERYIYEMQCRDIQHEPDTERQAEARAINADNRRFG